VTGHPFMDRMECPGCRLSPDIFPQSVMLRIASASIHLVACPGAFRGLPSAWKLPDHRDLWFSRCLLMEATSLRRASLRHR
jgi:hypothetical protein